MMKKCLLSVLFLLLLSALTPMQAQGDGPRGQLLAPKGLWVLTPAYLHLRSNFNFTGDIFLEQAEIQSNVFPITITHMFGIGGRMAQFWVTPIFGEINGEVDLGGDVRVLPKVTGSADPFVAFRIGLVGAPALTLQEYVQYKQGFQLYAYLRAYIPIGTYDPQKPINLGTNRWIWNPALPMVFPFGTRERPTYLEVTPAMRFFGKNDDPTFPTMGDELTEKPIFLVESNLTHNFTSKLWAGVALRYQVGGEVEIDGVGQDNAINQVGYSFNLGYQILAPLAAYVSYGNILASSNNANGEMFRVRVIFSYINTKKGVLPEDGIQQTGGGM